MEHSYITHTLSHTRARMHAHVHACVHTHQMTCGHAHLLMPKEYCHFHHAVEHLYKEVLGASEINCRAHCIVKMALCTPHNSTGTELLLRYTGHFV